MRLALVMVGIGLAGTALANPGTMAHQGRLMDSLGVPLSGSHDLTFRLYTTPIGGTAGWSETLTSVSLSDGYFSVMLGGASPLDGGIFDGTDQWLAVAVDSDPELASRKPIGAVPYAARAASVEWSDIDNIPADLADGDDVLTESDVEDFVTNGPLDLAVGTTLDGVDIAALGNTDWTEITGVPSELSDGDDVLSEAAVEGFVTNGALDFAAGTTVDGVDIGSLGNTAWSAISDVPADLADGDDQRSEAAVEAFVTNGPIDLHASSQVGGTSIASLGNTAQWSSISGIPSSIANGDQTLTESQVETFVTNGALDLAAGTSVDGVDVAALGGTANWSGISGIPADIANGDQQRSEATVETFITNGAINLHGSSQVGGTSIASLGNTAQWSNISGIPSDIANGDNVLTSSQVRSFVTSTPISLHQNSQLGGLNLSALGNSAQWNFITGVPAGLSDGDDVLSQSQVETYITNGAINLASGSEVAGVDIAVETDPMIVRGVHNQSTADIIARPTDPSATIVPGSMTTISPSKTGHKIFVMFNTNVRIEGDEGEYCQFSMRVSGGGYSATEFSNASTGWAPSAHQTVSMSGAVAVNSLSPLTVWVTVEALDGRVADPEVEPHLCRVGDRTLNSMMVMELD